MNSLTFEEELVLKKLIEAWNVFLELPVEHDDDIMEFKYGIHILQEKILARMARRVYAKGEF